jgi:bifunctional non-homologous end joining protein LigD
MAARINSAKRASKPRGPARRKITRQPEPESRGEHVQAGEVRLTHPDRVYWVDVGLTKQDLADYYRSVWAFMAPHIVGRALALVRCPEGTKGQCFFQKHVSAGLDAKALRTVTDRNGRQVIAVDDFEGVLSLVQAGVLEFHVRGAMIDQLDTCDRIVFDLDPDEEVAWSDVVAAALGVRERLAAHGLKSFVKLSGGKGLHVVMPIEGVDWDRAKAFASDIAVAMAAAEPKRYVAKMSKAVRRGKIFIDYLRNSLEQTSVAAYSTRARAGAPVSTPLDWEELARTSSGHQYSVLNVRQRLDRLKQDPWRDLGHAHQKLASLAKAAAAG